MRARGSPLPLLLVLALTPAGAIASGEPPPDPVPGPCHPPCAQPVFLVRRSLNQNELVYEANLTTEGFHARVPLQVYWVMKTRGGAREELTNLERTRAYGIKFLEIGAHEVRFSVKALQGIVFRAEEIETEAGARVHAFVTLDGEEMAVESVFISTEGGLIPKVHHIDFSGTSTSTLAPVAHRVVPKGAPPEAGTMAGSR